MDVQCTPALANRKKVREVLNRAELRRTKPEQRQFSSLTSPQNFTKSSRHRNQTLSKRIDATLRPFKKAGQLDRKRDNTGVAEEEEETSLNPQNSLIRKTH